MLEGFQGLEQMQTQVAGRDEGEMRGSGSAPHDDMGMVGKKHCQVGAGDDDDDDDDAGGVHVAHEIDLAGVGCSGGGGVAGHDSGIGLEGVLERQAEKPKMTAKCDHTNMTESNQREAGQALGEVCESGVEQGLVQGMGVKHTAGVVEQKEQRRPESAKRLHFYQAGSKRGRCGRSRLLWTGLAEGHRYWNCHSRSRGGRP
eukprot:jgi/Ulvmu1/6864/UM031_0069.1